MARETKWKPLAAIMLLPGEWWEGYSLRALLEAMVSALGFDMLYDPGSMFPGIFYE